MAHWDYYYCTSAFITCGNAPACQAAYKDMEQDSSYLQFWAYEEQEQGRCNRTKQQDSRGAQHAEVNGTIDAHIE